MFLVTHTYTHAFTHLFNGHFPSKLQLANVPLILDPIFIRSILTG